jgi:hypothetical protein
MADSLGLQYPDLLLQLVRKAHHLNQSFLQIFLQSTFDFLSPAQTRTLVLFVLPLEGFLFDDLLLT